MARDVCWPNETGTSLITPDPTSSTPSGSDDDEATVRLKEGLALRLSHRPGASLGPLKRAIRLRPGHAQSWHLLATALGDLGRYGESAEAFAPAARLDPRNPHVASDAVHLLHYDPAATPEAMLAAARGWGQRGSRSRGRSVRKTGR